MNAFAWIRERWAYGLALLPMLTDWIEVGHIPVHPREYITEVTIGVLIALGVRSLYRRAHVFQMQAETDALTGIGNRRALLSRLAGMLASGQPPFLIYLDLDGFKAVNDVHGHAAGDDVLRETARVLHHSTRKKHDVCYRVGGDEFVVLVEGNADATNEVLDRAESFARRSRLLSRFEVSFSAGVVEGRQGDSGTRLMARADEVMLGRKKEKRMAKILP